jgi:hypothetical protein
VQEFYRINHINQTYEYVLRKLCIKFLVPKLNYDEKHGILDIDTSIKKVYKPVMVGVIYNTYLCAKYGVKIAGVRDSDIELSKK